MTIYSPYILACIQMCLCIAIYCVQECVDSTDASNLNGALKSSNLSVVYIFDLAWEITAILMINR